MKRQLQVGAAVLAGSFLVVLGGATPNSETVQSQELPEGVTAEMIAQGKDIYAGAGLCSVCHGPEGAGGAIGPSLADDTWLHIEGTFEEIVTAITEGVSQPKEAAATMPPKGGSQISDDQVKAVAAYVWSLSQGG